MRGCSHWEQRACTRFPLKPLQPGSNLEDIYTRIIMIGKFDTICHWWLIIPQKKNKSIPTAWIISHCISKYFINQYIKERLVSWNLVEPANFPTVDWSCPPQHIRLFHAINSQLTETLSLIRPSCVSAPIKNKEFARASLLKPFKLGSN